MLGRKLVSTLKMALRLRARSSRSRGMAVWPIRMAASGSQRSKTSSGIGRSSETTSCPRASRRRRVSASQMTSSVRGSGSTTMRGLDVRSVLPTRTFLSLQRSSRVREIAAFRQRLVRVLSRMERPAAGPPVGQAAGRLDPRGARSGRSMAGERQKIEAAIGKGNGVLRLAPNWVPRSFCIPGKRLKLHPSDYYAFGAHRGRHRRAVVRLHDEGRQRTRDAPGRGAQLRPRRGRRDVEGAPQGRDRAGR